MVQNSTGSASNLLTFFFPANKHSSHQWSNAWAGEHYFESFPLHSVVTWDLCHIIRKSFVNSKPPIQSMIGGCSVDQRTRYLCESFSVLGRRRSLTFYHFSFLPSVSPLPIAIRCSAPSCIELFDQRILISSSKCRWDDDDDERKKRQLSKILLFPSGVRVTASIAVLSGHRLYKTHIHKYRVDRVRTSLFLHIASDIHDDHFHL